MKILLWIYYIYLTTKARILFKNSKLISHEISHNNKIIKYVGLVFLSPISKNYVRYSGMSETSYFEALLKAFAEYLEGKLCWEINLDPEESRSGVATHTSFENSFENAYLELIERDSFIMHFYCPKLTTYKLPQLNGIDFCKLQSVDAKVKVVIAKTNHLGKSYLSLAANENLNVAVEKALNEILMLCSEFDPLSSNCFFRENYLALDNPEVKSVVEKIFSGGEDVRLNRNILPKALVQVKKRYGAFFVLKLNSPSLLKLKFGIKWFNAYHEHIEVMKKRGLSIGIYKTHPLL